MSGFSEFEYAREAVRLGVVEYLLKPLEKDRLAAVLARVREEKKRESGQIRESMHAWLAGTHHRHDVSALFAPSCYAVILLYSYDSPGEALQNRVPEPMVSDRVDPIAIPCREGQLLLLYDQEEASLRNELQTLPERKLPDGVTGFISHLSADPILLGEEMHRILDLSPVRVFRGIGRYWKLNQVSATDEKETAKAKEWIELRDCWLEKRYADFVTRGAVLIPTIPELTPARLRHLTVFLSAFTGKKLPETAGPEETAAFLKNLGEAMIRQEAGSDRIDAVIEYVRKNCCEDISIAMLSAEFDLSPNYLGALFKKKLGLSFVDYLTSLRIAKARKLLLSHNLSVKEVGEAVGYYSQSYFTKIFIKKEGCTPGEYRKKGSGTRDPRSGDR